jgi:hypothetical protein
MLLPVHPHPLCACAPPVRVRRMLVLDAAAEERQAQAGRRQQREEVGMQPVLPFDAEVAKYLHGS